MDNKKPKLRFKGFTDDWEQRKLKDICEKFTDGDWIEAKDQSESGIRLIQTGNVGVTQYLEKSNNKKWISLDTFDKLHCKEIFEGDILISRLPEPAGRACIMPDIGKRMITAVDCTIVRLKKKYNNKYVVQYLSTNKYFNEVNTCLAGGTRQRISRNNLSNFDIPIPKNILEQKQIGTLFNKVDNLITLHQRKYDKLLNIKKSLLEKMFPKNSSNIPEIRFKGFTDAWEQRKLDELSKITMGQSPDGVNYTENPEDTILIQGNADLSNGKVVPRIYTKQITKISKPNDIIFTVRAPVGEVAKNSYNAVVGRGVASLTGNNFLYHTLKRLNEINYWNKLSAGSTFDSINSEQLKNIKIDTPKDSEQKVIGDFFGHMDNLITLHQRKYETLKNIKQALLEKMFI